MKLKRYASHILIMLKSLWKKGALYIFCGSFLMKIAAFLGSIVLVRLISKGDYGVLGYMENLYTYAYLFAGFGLNNAVFRYLVLAANKSEKAGVLDYVILRGTLINVVLLIVLCSVAYFYPHNVAFSRASFLLPIMLLAMPLQFLFDTGTYSLRALFDNRAYALFALSAAMGIWGSKVLGSQFAGITGAVLSWPITYLLMSIIILFYVKTGPLNETNIVIPSKTLQHEMNQFSFQYMITNGLWAMFLQNDLLLLGMLSGDPALVATYKVAYAIPAALSILSGSVGTFVAPYFVQNESNSNWIWSNYKRVLFFSIVCIGSISLVTFILSKSVVLFLYGVQYYDAIPVMRLLLFASFLSNAIRYTAANLLAAMGRVRVNLLISAIGMIIQIITDFLLIPRMGMIGAALSSVVVYLFMSVTITIYFVSAYKPKS